MKIGKISAAVAVTIALIMLSGCGETGSMESTESTVRETAGTSSENSETTSAIATALSESSETGTSLETALETGKNAAMQDYFRERGYDLSYPGTLCIDMENFRDGDEPLADVDGEMLKDISRITVVNMNGEDPAFIKKCSPSYLELSGNSLNAQAVADLLIELDLKSLCITVEEYSYGEADIIMKADPDCMTSFHSNAHSPAFEQEVIPKDGISFFANLCVNTSSDEDTFECITYDAEAFDLRTKKYNGSLICTIVNFSDEIKQVTSAEIFRDDNGKLTALPFSDGSLAYDPDFEALPGTNSEFKIPEDIFPFDSYEPGVYRIALEVDGERLERTFAVCNEKAYTVTADGFSGGTRTINVPAFLNGEQQEAFISAHATSDRCFGCSAYQTMEEADGKTVDEFTASCGGYTYDYAYDMGQRFGYIDKDGRLQAAFMDRGSRNQYSEDFFVPIYSDGNDVLFKSFIVSYHGDDPYHIWFAEYNYHMVKTDDGWRFDNFQLWY